MAKSHYLLKNFFCAVFIEASLSDYTDSEAVARGCSVKKVFLEISQNSQENACGRVSFLIKIIIKSLLKKRLWHRRFPVNFAKFLRTPFLTEHLRWLLLQIAMTISSAGCYYNSDLLKSFLFCIVDFSKLL